MRSAAHRTRVCLVVAALLGVGACDSTASSSEPPVLETADDAGADGSAQTPDPCVDTPNDPKCLDDATAFFVSADADAAKATGTRSAPFKTIAAALAKVTAEKKRIYVCSGDYPEQVLIDKSVAVIGGLACTWTGPGAKPKIAPPKGVAVTIKNAQTVALASLDIEGKADPQVKGDSAIGVFVSTATGAVLKDCSVAAGAATDGAAGESGDATPNWTAMTAVVGKSNSGAMGGAEAECAVCADSSVSKSGAGGTADGASPKNGSSTPPVPAPNVNGGFNGQSGCGPGTDGKNAAANTAKASGSALPGVVNQDGWTAASTATKGTNGSPGQGGGGGGGVTDISTGGGSGGCGGCGGTGGGPGKNGGSSFAVLAFRATVTISGGALASANGGRGGAGGDGQKGQFRGAGGAGACGGGRCRP